jgi:muramoyltetrapeptide carboxypeptidase
MGLLAHRKAPTWWGPLACDDFGRPEVDEVTPECFTEAMTGALEAVGFRTEAGFDGLDTRGLMWGGNLAMLCSLLGTPHWPKVKGGVLMLEDVGEHPYRVERMLYQLLHAGILARQRAVLFGSFTGYQLNANDDGYDFAAAIAHIRSRIAVPIYTGLPFGHVPDKLTLPVGGRCALDVRDGQATLRFSDYRV